MCKLLRTDQEVGVPDWRQRMVVHLPWRVFICGAYILTSANVLTTRMDGTETAISVGKEYRESFPLTAHHHDDIPLPFEYGMK